MEPTPEEAKLLVGKNILSNEDVASPYRLDAWMAGGSFGMVFEGTNENTQKKVAIKMEKHDAQFRQLYLEFGFYIRLGRHCDYAPRVHYFGYIDKWDALVLDLLGPSLVGLFKSLGKFSVTCTAAIGIDLFRNLQQFHDKGLLFRDVKPANFLVGPTDSENAFKVYLVDLGLAKDYRTEEGEHIPFATGKTIAGTPLYISVNMHKRCELSRRDDLESILYMLVQLQTGNLPWSVHKDQAPMGEMKMSMTMEEICAGMPSHFTSIFKAVRSLEFEEDPNYKSYIKRFFRILANNKISEGQINRAYDWNRSHKKRPSRRRSRRPSSGRSSQSPGKSLRRSRSRERQNRDSLKKKKKPRKSGG